MENWDRRIAIQPMAYFQSQAMNRIDNYDCYLSKGPQDLNMSAAMLDSRQNLLRIFDLF